MPLPITSDEKVRILNQVFSLFAKYGFDGISMDEVAKRVGLSKATIYKYFKSKEDIVRVMVEEITAHLNAVQFTTDNGIDGVLESLKTIYFKAVLTAAYSSSKFIADLKNKFPDIYADYIIALNSVQKRFSVFYKNAVREGYCKQISIGLLGEQIKAMLPAILSPAYLNSHKTTLHNVITEYCRLLLYQFLGEEYMVAANTKSTYSFVDNLVEMLDSKFLID